jgi:hypothetical protein
LFSIMSRPCKRTNSVIKVRRINIKTKVCFKVGGQGHTESPRKTCSTRRMSPPNTIQCTKGGLGGAKEARSLRHVLQGPLPVG